MRKHTEFCCTNPDVFNIILMLDSSFIKSNEICIPEKLDMPVYLNRIYEELQLKNWELGKS